MSSRADFYTSLIKHNNLFYTLPESVFNDPSILQQKHDAQASNALALRTTSFAMNSASALCQRDVQT